MIEGNKSTTQEESKAEKVLNAILIGFPTCSEFADLENIVGSYSLKAGQDNGLSDKDSENFICILQALKWIRQEVY